MSKSYYYNAEGYWSPTEGEAMAHMIREERLAAKAKRRKHSNGSRQCRRKPQQLASPPHGDEVFRLAYTAPHLPARHKGKRGKNAWPMSPFPKT